MPFGAFASAHLAIVIVSRLYTPEVLSQSLLAVIPAVAFTPVGIWLRRFVSRNAFDTIIRIVLVVMSLRLIYASWLGG